MARPLHPEAKIPYPFSQSKKQSYDFTSQEAKDLTIKTLEEKVTLPRPEGAYYALKEFFSIALYSGVNRITVEEACSNLENTPHSNAVRGDLAPLKVNEVEAQINGALEISLPRDLLKFPVEVAIDLKFVPYYGQSQEGEEDFLLKSKARQGTTTFFGYASIYLIKRNKRFTIAVKTVRRSEGLVGVLRWLLSRFGELGGKILCLYLDRQFFTVGVLRFLKEEKDIPFAMAAPKKGKKGGIKSLTLKGKGIFPYTVRSPKEGEIDVQVAIVGKYFKGRWGKHERERYAFIIHRYPFSLQGLFEKYRHRFGIESSYRIWDQARARTASRSAGLRLLLIGISVLLNNIWVFIKWVAACFFHRLRKSIVPARLTFKRLLILIARALEKCYGINEIILRGKVKYG